MSNALRTLGKSNAALFDPSANQISIVTDGGVPAGVFLPFTGNVDVRQAQAREVRFAPVYHVTKLAKDIIESHE